MSAITLSGPAVESDRHNVMLRKVLLHVPTDRSTSGTDYYVVSVGISDGAFTTWIGSWDQSAQKVLAGTPLSVLDDDRADTRVTAGQTLVAKIEATGSPDTIEGCRLGFRFALVGSRYDEEKPLIATGNKVSDPDTRNALDRIERQVNSGGLAEWEDSIQLHDPIPQVAVGAFGGRMQRDSATQISLQRYVGDWVEVDGVGVAIGSDGLEITTSDGLLESSGVIGTTAPSVSTLYYVYVGSQGLRLCATAPSAYLGTLSLGTDVGARSWRFVGWVYLDGSTNFTDDETAREVVNYYNRRPARLFTCPGYTDNDAYTSYTTTSTTWVQANGGTGSQVSFIANGEDAASLSACSTLANSGANNSFMGIGIDSGTECHRSAQHVGTTASAVGVSYEAAESVGRHTVDLVIRVNAGTGTYYADSPRGGATADPAATFLSGWVMT